MKLETQEKIRLIELAAGTLVSSGLLLANMSQVDNYMELRQLQNLCVLPVTPYFLNYLLSFREETYSDEYKKIQGLYQEVLSNTNKLLTSTDKTSPIEVFAMYMYMYRHGYLSVEKSFVYENNMKDFAKLGGVDVIRGTGVCRSVASLLTDIYETLGESATNLTVKANDSIAHIEKLCDKDKVIVDEKTKKFVRIITKSTEKLPMNNHQISTLEKDGKNYIFDPMNDGFLVAGEKNRIHLANDPKYFMSFYTLPYVIVRTIGQVKTKSPLALKKQFSLPTVSYEEYKDIYLNTLSFAQRNIDAFEDFYRENQGLYQEIASESDKQENFICRAFGISPVVKSLRKARNK